MKESLKQGVVIALVILGVIYLIGWADRLRDRSVSSGSEEPAPVYSIPSANPQFPSMPDTWTAPPVTLPQNSTGEPWLSFPSNSWDSSGESWYGDDSTETWIEDYQRQQQERRLRELEQDLENLEFERRLDDMTEDDPWSWSQ